MDVDILIENATIVDGYWKTPYVGSVTIKDGIIDVVSVCRQTCSAKKVIDAKGKYLIPGIIDMHSHSDLKVVQKEQFRYKIAMGITSEVIGNCGIGSFPLTDTNQLNSLNLDILGGSEQFTSFDSYKKAYFNAPPSTNIVALQAHSPIRYEVMKERAHQKATDIDIMKMKQLLHTSFDQGVKGFSSGLYYEPCQGADKRELLALLSVVKERGGIFAVHHRQEGDGIIESIKEVLTLSLLSGVSLQISHLKAIGNKNQDKVKEVLHEIETFHNKGLDVTFDQYPYEWGATSLASLLPPAVLTLPLEDRRKLLSTKEGQKEVRDSIMHPVGFDSIIHLCGFDDIRMLTFDADESVVGKTMSEIATMWKTDVWDAFFTLILQAGNNSLMSDITQSRESIELIMAHPLGTFSTDAIYSGSQYHRRSSHAVQDLFDIFYVEKKVLTLSEHIRRMCVLPARKLKLENRGMILPGYIADVVIIDIPETTQEKTQVDSVIVGGKIAYENNEMRSDYSRYVL